MLHWNRLTKTIVGVVAIAAAGVATAVVAGATDVPANVRAAQNPLNERETRALVAAVDHAGLQRCIAANEGNCEDKVPGLRACLMARLQCNPPADDPKPEEGQAAASPALDEASVISRARQLAIGDAQAQQRNPAKPAKMTYANYLALRGEGGTSPTVPLSREIWVVTVHGPIETDAPAGAVEEVKSVYTVAFDPATNAGIEVCMGCDVVR
jgi:hypothetical protein